MKFKITRRQSGFTLVELAVVVAVIGILAGVVSIGFGSWQQNLAKNLVQSDMKQMASAMESAKNFSNGYPTTLPTSFKASPDVTITYIGGNTTSYCIEAKSSKFSSMSYYIDSQSKNPQLGTCGGAYAMSSPLPSLTSKTSSSLTISWSSIAGATSYVVKYGTSSPNVTANCTTSPCSISSLASSTSYRVTVTAINSVKTEPSNTLTAMTSGGYTCPNGGTLSGTTCTQTYAATYNSGSGYYSCPSGGTLSGSTCTTTSTYTASEGPGGYYDCPSGTYPGGPYGGTCYIPGSNPTQYVSEDYHPGPYSCPNGGTLNGTQCTKSSTYSATYNSTSSAGYTCPSGGTLSGSTCTRTYPATQA